MGEEPGAEAPADRPARGPPGAEPERPRPESRASMRNAGATLTHPCVFALAGEQRVLDPGPEFDSDVSGSGDDR